MEMGRTEAARKHPRTREGPGAVPAWSTRTATDGQLLTEFAGRGERGSEAFAELVRRHGAMVLATCRALLFRAHDAEDAFQATFLVLALRAGSVRKPELLGPWLHGVAVRVSQKARGRIERLRRREGQEVAMGTGEPVGETGRFDLALVRREEIEALHQELDRLPECYRVPLVLCDLGGLTHAEAAERLRWPSGSVSVRLVRARALLRDRLSRRGVGPGSAMSAVMALSRAVSDEVPASLASTAVRAAERVAVGLCPAATGVSSSAARLSVRVHLALSRRQLILGGSHMIGGFAVLTLMTSLLATAGQPDATAPYPKSTEGSIAAVLPPRGDVLPPSGLGLATSLPEAFGRAGTRTIRSDGTRGEVRNRYNDLARQADRDADAQVELALWCEANGLPEEKSRHLSMAVLRRPEDFRARGLLGLVSYDGRWKRPDAVAAAVERDTGLSASLAAYNARRERTLNTADAHWKLALWCEQNGLKPEATAHLVQATRLDPGHEAAWKHLGCKRVNGRWVSQDQAEAEKLEARRQKEANRLWTPLLAKWRGWLNEEDPARQADAEQALSGVSDPHAVPAVWSTFGRGPERAQRRAVQLFGQIDAPSADLALGVLAISSPHANVRKAACETLRRRDARAAFDLLVGLLRDPEPNPRSPLVRSQILPTGALGIGSPGVVYVEGPDRAALGIFTVDESWGRIEYSSIVDQTGIPVQLVATDYHRRVAMQRERQVVALELTFRAFLAEALADVLPVIARIRQGNERVMDTLRNIQGTSPGDSWEDWKRWWVEQRGYAYDPGQFKNPARTFDFREKPVSVETFHLSCFAAGTPVRTLSGRRPIETVRVGDRVLTQDVETGALTFAPVLAAIQNRPAPTVRVDLEGVEKPVVATDIHRFWRPGRGWVMARDLSPGDAVRTLGGLARVARVSAEAVQPVYNLEVGRTQSFFAGEADALVHDNSGVSPVARPFDRVSEN